MKNYFLIIQTAFIGDVILSTSLIESLHKTFPDADIDFLLRDGNEQLFDNHPYINKLLVWQKRKNKYKNLFKLLKTIRNNSYTHVINCQRFGASGLLTIFSKAGTKAGFTKNPFSFLFDIKAEHSIGNGTHETERNHRLIESITENLPEKPRLYPYKKNYEQTAPYKKKPYLCIAPASVWKTKQFPVDKWIELLSRIKTGYTVYLLGSKNDFNLCETIVNNTGGIKIINLAGKLNLLDTAALMKNAEMNYTNDSAPLHIASAMNAKITAVFCSTIPEFGFGPLSDNDKIVEVKTALDCRPCGIHGHKQCPKKHFKCAYDIDVEDLLF